MFKKLAISFFILLAFQIMLQSQTASVLARIYTSIGFEYEFINYNGADIPHSGGGGGGLELGVSMAIQKGFSAYASLGYHQNLVLQIENNNGFTNRSSVSFNRKFLSAGIKQRIKLSENTLQGLIIGIGGSYNFPGKLKRIENESEYGDISYSNDLGLHVELALRFRLSKEKGIYIEPGLRYRNLSFKAKELENRSLSDLTPYFLNLDANGIEIGATITKAF